MGLMSVVNPNGERGENENHGVVKDDVSGIGILPEFCNEEKYKTNGGTTNER